jgi:hypothetical protein
VILLQSRSSQLEQNYESSQVQIGLLQEKTSQLETNYTNIQNQYTQLEANYTALYNEFHPTLAVAFWKQQPVQAGTGVDYVFNITGTRETFEFGPRDVINQGLATLLGKYPFVTIVTSEGLTAPFWMSQYLNSGKFGFSLRIESQLTTEQLQALTQDLTAIFKNL